MKKKDYITISNKLVKMGDLALEIMEILDKYYQEEYKT